MLSTFSLKSLINYGSYYTSFSRCSENYNAGLVHQYTQTGNLSGGGGGGGEIGETANEKWELGSKGSKVSLK